MSNVERRAIAVAVEFQDYHMHRNESSKGSYLQAGRQTGRRAGRQAGGGA